MTKVIAIAQHKGGVGKTTSAANIGAGLAKRGKKVLLIDFDPQANLTTILGGPLDYENNIYNVLSDKAVMKPVNLSENLDIIPADLDLSGAELELAGIPGREFILKEKLEPVKDQYDLVLIDCPPSLGLLTVNALVAASDIFLPLQSQFLAMHGLGKLMEVVELVKARLNPHVVISGVFITMYDSRRTIDKDIADVIKRDFRELVYETKIRSTVALVEAGCQGQSIFDYSPSSNGSEDYLSLTDEIISKVVEV